MELLQNHWISPHPIPEWVNKKLPEKIERIKVVERAALIEDTGHTVNPGCQLCETRGFECKILTPSEGSKTRCARCTNFAKICSLSDDQGWDGAACASIQHEDGDHYRRRGEGRVQDNYHGENEERFENFHHGGDEEGTEVEKLEAAQPQHFEGVAERIGQDGGNSSSKEQHHGQEIVYTRPHPLLFRNNVNGGYFGLRYDEIVRHIAPGYPNY